MELRDLARGDPCNVCPVWMLESDMACVTHGACLRCRDKARGCFHQSPKPNLTNNTLRECVCEFVKDDGRNAINHARGRLGSTQVRKCNFNLCNKTFSNPEQHKKTITNCSSACLGHGEGHGARERMTHMIRPSHTRGEHHRSGRLTSLPATQT